MRGEVAQVQITPAAPANVESAPCRPKSRLAPGLHAEFFLVPSRPFIARIWSFPRRRLAKRRLPRRCFSRAALISALSPGLSADRKELGGRGVTEWKEERVEGETEGWKVKPRSEKGRQLVMPCLCVCVTQLGSGLGCFVWRDAAADGRAPENDSVKVPLNTFFSVFCTTLQE